MGHEKLRQAVAEFLWTSSCALKKVERWFENGELEFKLAA